MLWATQGCDLLIRVRDKRVLMFLSVRAAAMRPGPVAQWKSVPFTPGRSLVRSQPGPLFSDSRPQRLQWVLRSPTCTAASIGLCHPNQCSPTSPPGPFGRGSRSRSPTDSRNRGEKPPRETFRICGELRGGMDAAPFGCEFQPLCLVARNAGLATAEPDAAFPASRHPAAYCVHACCGLRRVFENRIRARADSDEGHPLGCACSHCCV